MGLSPIRNPRYVKDILRLPTQKEFLPGWALQSTGSPITHQSQTSDLMTSPDLGEIGSREKEQILALPPPPAQTQQAAANPLKWEGALGPPGCPGVPAGRAASGHAPWGSEVRR